jgi:hypothetical protein
MMSIVAAFIFTAVIALLVIFQLALAFGAPLGRFAWGGQHTVLPTRLRRGSIFAVAVYVAFSVILLAQSGVITIPVLEPVSILLCWMIAAYLFIGIVMNALSRSKPERFVMTPVAAVLTACALLVALG